MIFLLYTSFITKQYRSAQHIKTQNIGLFLSFDNSVFHTFRTLWYSQVQATFCNAAVAELPLRSITAHTYESIEGIE
jgi:hypothetical protein